MKAIKSLVRRAIENAGYEIVKKEKDLHVEGGMTTIHNHEFVHDHRFTQAYNFAIEQAGPLRPHGKWRVHVAQWVASNAIRLGGDFVECGVFHGFVSAAVMDYVNWNETCGSKRFFLFDTYEGLVTNMLTSEERESGRAEQYGEMYSDTYDDVRRAFKKMRNTFVVKGAVPDILPSANIELVSYVHLDMNCAAPEVAVLEYFWPKMTTGGLILMDDYAYLGYEPQNKALGETARKFGREILSLPTGQGLLVK